MPTLKHFSCSSFSFPRDLMKCSFKWGYTGYKYKRNLYFRPLALLVLNKPFDKSHLFIPSILNSSRSQNSKKWTDFKIPDNN